MPTLLPTGDEQMAKIIFKVSIQIHINTNADFDTIF